MCESASMAKEEDKFMLQVQVGFPGLPGSELQVTAFAKMTITVLKSSLAIASRTPAIYQRLLTSDGQILSEDAETLEELGLTAGSKVQLVRISPEKGTLRSVCSSGGRQADRGVALLRYTLECCVDDPNEVGPTGTPLHLAACNGNLDICKVLLDSERFTAVNARCALEGLRCYADFTYPASTALHYAAARGHVDVCKLLLQDPRTQVNAKDGFGYTALHIAVAQRAVDVCAALLVHDPLDIEAEDQHGASALQVAIACCMPEDMKYRMHDLTQDGGCWSTSRRWTCLQKSFSVFELFMQSKWYKMNPKRLEDAFSNARRFLESGPEATRRPTIETLVAWWRLEAATGIPQNEHQLLVDIQEAASEDVDLCAPLTGEQQREWIARVKRFAMYELSRAPGKVQASFEVVKVAVTEQGEALRYASDALRDNCEIVLAALTQQPRAFQFASERLKADRGLMIAALSKGFGGALFHTSAQLKADRNTVIAACEQSPMLFKYAAQELRADRDFVLEVLRRTSLSLNSFTEDLRVDREVLLAALAQDGNLLQDVPAAFQGDREIVLTAVAQDGCALEYVAEDLNMDREVVLTAISQDGNALEYAAEELKADREIVFAALGQDGSALEHAAEELKSDREAVTQAVLQDGLALQYAAEKFQSDYGIVIVAVAQDGNALEFAAEELQMERNIVLAAVAQNGLALQHAAEPLRTDHEVVLRAVTQRGLALKWASQECKGDSEIVRVAMLQNLAAVQYAAEKLQTNCDSLWADFGNILTTSLRLENNRILLLNALVKVFQIEHCCALIIVQEGMLEALVGLLCEETRECHARRSNVTLRRLGLISQVFAILAMHGKYSDLIAEAGALEPLVAVLCEGDVNGEFGHAVFHAAFALRFLTVGYKCFRSHGHAIMEAGAWRPLQIIMDWGGDLGANLESGIAMGALRALRTVEMAFKDAPGP